MKKLFGAVIALALTASLAGPVQAQIYVGGSAGATYFKAFGSDVPTDRKFDWGFTAGAFGQLYLNPNFALNLEANWIQKNSTDSAGTDAGKLKLSYLEVPLTLNIVFPFDDDWYGLVYVGGSIGFNMSCSAGGADCLPEPEGTEFAIPVGGGIGKKLASGMFVGLNVRYSYGMSDIVDQVGAKNRGWMFMARVGFPIGGN
jgi:opacity protein-like surface antigen